MTEAHEPTDPILLNQDPWLFLKAMRELVFPARMQYLKPWIDLVSKCPPLERDALIEAGKELWRYRVSPQPSKQRKMR